MKLLSILFLAGFFFTLSACKEEIDKREVNDFKVNAESRLASVERGIDDLRRDLASYTDMETGDVEAQINGLEQEYNALKRRALDVDINTKDEWESFKSSINSSLDDLDQKAGEVKDELASIATAAEDSLNTTDLSGVGFDGIDDVNLVDSRDNSRKALAARLQAVDDKVAELKEEAADEAGDAKDKVEKQLSTLSKKSKELKNKLEESTEDQWEEIKEDFGKGLKELEDELDKLGEQ